MNNAMYNQARQMLSKKSPQQIKQELNGIQNMSQDDLKRMMAMTGVNMNPQQVRASLKAMNNQDISNLKRQAENIDPSRMPGIVNQSPFQALTAKKNQANLQFKDKKFLLASQKYQQVVHALEKGKFSKENKNNLMKICLLNMAACKIQLNQFNEALIYCSRVLKIDPKNIKSYFRAAKAHKHMEDFPEAVAYAKRALYHSSNQDQSNKASCQQFIKDTQNKLQNEDDRILSDKIEKRLIKNEKTRIEYLASPQQNNKEQQEYEQQKKLPNNVNMNTAKQMLQNMNDQQLSNQCSMMKQMDPENLQKLLGAQGQNLSLDQIKMMQGAVTPQLMKSSTGMQNPNPNMGFSDIMKNPQLIKSSLDMLKNMDDDHPMKKMLNEKAGGNLDIDKVIKMAGYVQKVASGVNKTKQAVCSRTGKLILTLSVFFFIAYMTGFL